MTTAEKDATSTVPIKAEATTAPATGVERRLRRFDPFAMLDEMQDEMTRFWGQSWPFAPLAPRAVFRPRRRLEPITWLPSTDIYEKHGSIIVKAELPGMKKDDIAVTLEEGDLVIKGERRAENEVKEDAYYRMERSYGSFYRRIPLGFEVKAEQITASYEDGVLEVQVPKPPQGQPQTHTIPLT